MNKEAQLGSCNRSSVVRKRSLRRKRCTRQETQMHPMNSWNRRSHLPPRHSSTPLQVHRVRAENIFLHHKDTGPCSGEMMRSVRQRTNLASTVMALVTKKKEQQHDGRGKWLKVCPISAQKNQRNVAYGLRLLLSLVHRLPCWTQYVAAFIVFLRLHEACGCGPRSPGTVSLGFWAVCSFCEYRPVLQNVSCSNRHSSLEEVQPPWLATVKSYARRLCLSLLCLERGNSRQACSHAF